MTHHVILDYGHGGSKSGAAYGGAIEKQLNYLTGTRVYDALKQQGKDIRVLLTRDDDYDVPLSVRCEMINQCKQHYDVDLAVSIHYNAASVPAAKGFEVYYLKGSDKGSAAADAILSQIEQQGIGVRGHGKKTTEELGRKLAFIHKTTPPAVLVEVGFLTNEEDREKALMPSYRQRVAEGIAQGIWQYLQTKGEG